MGSFRIEVRSRLATDAVAVWRHACTMEGVNAELGPWLRMSVPRAARGKTLADVAVGAEAFASVLLWLGVVPFDVHHLTLESVQPLGFVEESWSLLQKRWRHERAITSDGAGCVVVDRLTVEPRFAPAWAVRPMVQAAFDGRHRWLRERFGDAG